MNRPSTRSILEAIGVLGVIASLLFVGLQLQLDRSIALGAQYHERSESRKADIRADLESEIWMSRISKLWEAGDRPNWWTEEFEDNARSSQLTGAEIWASIYRDHLLFFQIDNVRYQYEQDLLPIEFWNGTENTLRAVLRDPFRRAVFASQGGRLGTIVRDLIEEIENE